MAKDPSVLGKSKSSYVVKHHDLLSLYQTDDRIVFHVTKRNVTVIPNGLRDPYILLFVF